MEYMQLNPIRNGPIHQTNAATQNSPRSITIADFERICRTCLCIGEEIRPIFEITHDTISMHTILDTLIALRVRKKDDLPKHLCRNCIAEMCRFYTFRDKCRNVQNTLEAIHLQALKREDHDQNLVKEEILLEAQLVLRDGYDNSIVNDLDFGAISDDYVDNNDTEAVKLELTDTVEQHTKEENDGSDDDDIPLGNRFKLIIKNTANGSEFETKDDRLKRERQERKERREKKEQKLKRAEEDQSVDTKDRHEKRRQTKEINRKLLFNDVKNKHRKQRTKTTRKLKQRLSKYQNGKIPAAAFPSSQEETPPSSPNPDPNTPKNYKCRDCPETFPSRHLLNEHRREARHPEVRTHECHICRKMFTSSKLRQHMRSHTKEKPFVCKVCGKGFTMSGNLKRHTMSHTGERPHVCEICGKGFIQHTTLIAHRRVHAKTYDSLPGADEPQFNCDQCGRGFKRLWRFNQHLTRHHTQQTHPNQISLPPVKRAPVSFPTCVTREQSRLRVDGEEMAALDGEVPLGDNGDGAIQKTRSNPTSPSVGINPSTTSLQQKHACPICFRSYKSKLYLKSHMATHGEKKFLCSDCGKGFVTKAALQSHLKVHTGEKPHKCTLCHKSFAHVGSFESHMLIHTGQKPYSCNICGKNFTQLSHLKYHLRIHSGEKPYACSYCGKCFALKGNLTVHVRTHTGETPYVCPDCGKGFYDSSSMKKHRRGHGEMQGKGPILMNSSSSDQPEAGEIPSVIMQHHHHHQQQQHHDQQQQQQQTHHPLQHQDLQQSQPPIVPSILPALPSIVPQSTLSLLPLHVPQQQQQQQQNLVHLQERRLQEQLVEQQQEHLLLQQIHEQEQQTNVLDLKYPICGKKF